MKDGGKKGFEKSRKGNTLLTSRSTSLIHKVLDNYTEAFNLVLEQRCSLTVFLLRIIALCGRAVLRAAPPLLAGALYESGTWVLAMGLSGVYVVGGGYDAVVRAGIFFFFFFFKDLGSDLGPAAYF